MKKASMGFSFPRRTLRWFSVILLLGLLVLSPAALAGEPCQPYVPQPSLVNNLEELFRTQPGAAALSAEQRAKLEALAREKSSEGLEELAKLEVYWKFSRPVPLPNPSSGPAPLTVEIVWPRYPVPNPAKIEFDADGDGKPEWVQDTYEVAMPRQYVYHRPGQYEYTVRVHERNGQVRAYKNRVKVWAPAQFDAELKARWSGLKEALRQGDITSALHCVHTHSRSRYHQSFQALKSTLARQVDDLLPLITAVSHRRAEAIYEALRTDNGVTKSFEVRFGIDIDGIWRITAF